MIITVHTFRIQFIHCDDLLAFSCYQFLYDALISLTMYVFAFSLLEKYQRENFIINTTNERSRKMLIKMLDLCETPVVIVQQTNWNLLFFN